MANENHVLMHRKKEIFVALIAVAVVTAVSVVLRRDPGPLSGHPLEGKQAPPLAFELSPGKNTSVAEMKGKALFINFWALWCQPCIEEMPSLVMLENHFKSQGLVLLAFNVEEDSKDVEGQITGMELPSNVILNFNKKYLEPYDVRAIPVSMLIDKSGTIRRVYEGPREWMDTDILHEIEEVLK